jgi:hypothetical protein
MRKPEEIKEKIAECEKSIQLQKQLRDTLPKGTADYYAVDRMINNFYRTKSELNWVLDEDSIN